MGERRWGGGGGGWARKVPKLIMFLCMFSISYVVTVIKEIAQLSSISELLSYKSLFGGQV